MYFTLGDIKFEKLKGFSSFGIRSEQNIAEHEIIEGKPRLQNAGSKADELGLGIHLNSQFSNCKKDYDALKKSKEAGEALVFIDGAGVYYGDYVIRSMEVAVNYTAVDGTWTDIDITLTLAEDTYAGEATPDQFATLEKMPIISSGEIPVNGDAANIMKDVQKVSTGANHVDSLLDKAKRFEQNANAWMDKATGKLSSITGDINSLQSRLTNALTIGTSGAALLNQILALQSSVNGVMSYTAMHDLQNSLLNNVLFQGQITQMFTNSAQLANMTALRI